MEKLEIYKNFWNICEKDINAAVIYLNNHSTGIAVPTFLKFTLLPTKGCYVNKKAKTLINVQELKPKHIQSLMNGWPNGHADPIVSNIWFRLLREANITMNELPANPITCIEATFTPVKFTKETCDSDTDRLSEEITTGYIIIDFSKNQW